MTIHDLSANDYLELQNLCNQVDLSGLYFNKEVKYSGNILSITSMLNIFSKDLSKNIASLSILYLS